MFAQHYKSDARKFRMQVATDKLAGDGWENAEASSALQLTAEIYRPSYSRMAHRAARLSMEIPDGWVSPESDAFQAEACRIAREKLQPRLCRQHLHDAA